MAWEYRGGRLYYYRKTRQGKKVISEYVGTGDTAELIYVLDASDQQERDRTQREWKAHVSEIQAVDLEIEHLNGLLKKIVLAVLLTSGYHPHKGQWRGSRYD
jgi:hypothetical protein